MLYNFKFTIFTHGDWIFREDIITAATAADADILYNKNIYDYLSEPQKTDEVGGQIISRRISIECLGEINNEIPQQNRVTVLLKSINISDTYTYALDMPVTVNGELIHWGFGVNNRSIAIVKILADVISTNPALSSQPILISKGQVMEIMPHQLRYI